jgi:hypothetical protein
MNADTWFLAARTPAQVAARPATAAGCSDTGTAVVNIAVLQPARRREGSRGAWGERHE